MIGDDQSGAEPLVCRPEKDDAYDDENSNELAVESFHTVKYSAAYCLLTMLLNDAGPMEQDNP